MIGSTTGLSTSTCSAACPLGKYCVSGSSQGAACPAGKYGGVTGLPSASCSGDCPAGFICELSTGDSSTFSDCGPVGVYCLAGTSSIAGRKTPQVGFYTFPTTSNGASEVICPKGFYCTGGIKTSCPKGTYGGSEGLKTSSCSGQCRKGYHCPTESISPTQEPCAPDNDLKKEKYYCPTGVGRVEVSVGKMTGPIDVSKNHREFQTNCPANAECIDGIATQTLAWSGQFSPCNANAISSTVFGWSSDTVASASVPEATTPASASLTLEAFLAPSLTGGTIVYKFHKCPSCCTGQQCVGNCQSVNSPGAPFELISNSGSVSLRPISETVLDAETCTSPYYYQISASTTAGSGAQIYCQLALSIADVNEAPSVNVNQQRTVVEESLKGTEVGSPLVASDPEVAAGTQGLTWSITECIGQGNGNACPFRIRACSGQLVVQDPTRIDFDDSTVSNPFTLQVIAKDDGQPSRSSVATTIKVFIANRNDPPTVTVGQIFQPQENVDVAEEGCTYSLDPCVCLLRCPSGTSRVGDGSACRSSTNPSNNLLTCDLGHCHGNPNSASLAGGGNCQQGSNVGTVGADDPDSDTLKYTTSTEDGCPFEVGTTDGVIRVTGVVNYESRRDWTLKVSVTDPSGKSSEVVDVVVNVQNQNDPPQFENSIVATIREDCTAGATSIGCTHQLYATDEDNFIAGTTMGSPLTYSVVANTCGIDVTSTGSIQPSSSNGDFDYETKPTCNVAVKVTDNGANGGSTTIQTFTINFLDVNENPAFTTPMATCTVAEDFSPQNTLPAPCVLSGTDPDTGVIQTLSFSATAVGDVTVQNANILILQELDFETTQTYSITVTLRDDGPTGTQLGSFGMITGTQTVTITDVNEPPVLATGLIFSCDENTATNTRFYIKKDLFSTLTIDSQDLQITEGMTVAQVVRLDISQIVVETSDDGSGVATVTHADTSSVRLRVRDTVDISGMAAPASGGTFNVPVKVTGTPTSTTFTFATEGIAASTTNPTSAPATGKATTAVGSIVTSVSGTTTSVSIISEAEEIFVSATAPSQDLVIDAAGANIIIPGNQVTQASNVLKPANNEGLSAVDPETSTLVYTLRGTSSIFDGKNNPYNYFAIDSITDPSLVTLKVSAQTVDFEEIANNDGTLEVHITVTDNGMTRDAGGNLESLAGASDLADETGVVAVFVRDVNESPTLVAKQNGIKVGSATSINSVVSILDWRDPDKDDTIKFYKTKVWTVSLSSSQNVGSVIQGTTTVSQGSSMGVFGISVIGTTQSLKIHSTADQTFVSSEDLVFTDGAGTNQIIQGSDISAIVGSFVGWEDDTGANTFYGLSATTGEIALLHDASGNGGTSSTVTAYAKDAAGLMSKHISYIVTVVSQNTAPTMPPQTLTISEGTAINSTVGAVLSSVVVDSQANAVCDPSQVKRPNDGLAGANILCTALSLSDCTTTDSNDVQTCALTPDGTACTCRQQTLLFTLENLAPLASELEDQQSDLADYPFEITDAGLIKVVSKLDFETIPGELTGLQSVYTLTIKVDDTGTKDNSDGTFENSLSAISTMTISITNVQEKPFFSFQKKFINVAENAYSGVDFIIDTKIYVTDPDLSEWSNGKITFAMADHTADPNHSHPGGIDPDSLFDFISGPILGCNSIEGCATWDVNAEQHWTKLQLVSMLNYESMQSYTLEIVAKDTVNSLESEEVEIVIQVLDVNEPPSFTAVSTTMSVSEDAAAGSAVGTIAATDLDVSDTSLTFVITAGAEEGEFSINQLGMSMELTVGESGLDFEKKRQYTIVVMATDNGGLTALSNVIVNVDDVNDVEITNVKIGSGLSLSTSGGDVMTIVGTDFGLTDGTSTNVVVTYFRRNSVVTPFTTTGCQVVVLNTMINCTTASDGYGTDLLVKVVISGTANGEATSSSDAVIRFQQPVITSVSTVSATPMPTMGSGTQNVILTGKNFGPTGITWKAEYGISRSAGYCATGCTVTIAHKEIRCKSQSGVGSGHTWRLMLDQDGEGTSFYESLSSEGSTSYAASTVIKVSTEGGSNIDTKGGDSLTLEGENFGASSHTLAHCNGRAVTVGSDAKPAPLPLQPLVRYGTESNPSKYTATECSVVVDHTKIICKKTPAGVGAGMKVRVDIGYLNYVVEGVVSSNSVTIDYQRPSIYSVEGSGALASSTAGGDVLDIEGRGFGPVGHATSVRLMYQQSTFTSARTKRPTLPTFYAVDCRVLSDQSMACKTGIGVGYNLTYKVEIEGQHSDQANNAVTGAKALGREPSHKGGAYSRPTLSTVTQIDGNSIYNANTRGYELVLIKGTNFGPIESWNPVTATFGLPPLSPGAAEQQFSALACNVTRAHLEITCLTSQGAGSKHQWKVQVAGLKSVLAETSFGKPNIVSIEATNAAGSKISVHALSSRGGETVTLLGSNFGPAGKSSIYLKSVTYGVTGVENICINAKVINHETVTCKTSEGTGKGLIFTINVLGQIGLSDVTVSYAPPTLVSISASADTVELDPAFRIALNGTNAGVGLQNGNVITVLWDDLKDEIIPDKFLAYRDGNIDAISFRVPELIGRDGARAHNVPVRLRVTETDGSIQTSAPIFWSYKAPVIEQVHVTSGAKPSQRRLTLVGSNFGRPSPSSKFPIGSVLLTNGDGGGECVSLPCEVPLFAETSDMYIEAWHHRAITVVYTGTFGTMVVRTSRVNTGTLESNAQNFSNTSPTVLDLSSDQSGKLIYPSLGYSLSDGGTLTIVCLYCDQVFLSVLVGEYRTGAMAGRSPQANLDCPIIGTPEYPLTLQIQGESIEQLTRIVCKVPAGLGTNVSVVVVRAGSRSLEKYELQYLAPSIDTISDDTIETRGDTITILGQNFGDAGAATCYLDELPLPTTTVGVGRDQLSCVIPAGIGAALRDVWVRVAEQDSCRKSRASALCLGSAPTLHYLPPRITNVQLPPIDQRSTEGNYEITLIGDNFATTSGLGSNVSIGGTECVVTETSFNEIKCIVQEAVGEDLGVQVQVADQISGPSAVDGGISSLPILSYTKPEIYSISPRKIPTNATKSDGTRYLIELVGRNFGNDLLTKGFRIYVGEQGSNNVATIETGDDVIVHDHRRIVFRAPPGQGEKLQIVVEVGPTLAKAQNSTDLIYLNYEPPTVMRTMPASGPTDGCSDRLGWEPLVVWAERIDGVAPDEVAKDPTLYRRKCKVPFMIDVFGENFGTHAKYMTARAVSKEGKVFQIYPPDETQSHECPNLLFTHNRMSLCSPIGYGVSHDLLIDIGKQPITNAMKFSFDPPTIIAVDRNPYDGSKNDKLSILGTNFGGINVGDVQVRIGNFPCSNAAWNGAHPSDGFPYISCTSHIDVVGSQNISLFVAGQQATPLPVLENDFTSIVRSECLPGEITLDGTPNNTYGRRGELCAPCPRGGICRSGNYQAPIAESGFWLQGLDVTTPGAVNTDSAVAGEDPMTLRERQDYLRAAELDDVTKARRCPPSRLFDPTLDALLRVQHPTAAAMRRDLCLEAQSCVPNEACLGANTCHEAYLYQQKKCQLAVIDQKLNLPGVSNCTVSLQCRTRSYGTSCALAIASVCQCQREDLPGSYSCLKKCIREQSTALIERGGCPSQEVMAGLHAGQECLSGNPEDCSLCVISDNATTLDSTGICECAPATRCSLCTANEYYRIDGKCETCPSNPEYIIIGFVVGVVFISIGCYILDKRNFNLAFISIGVDYFQVLAIFASVDVEWPAAIKAIFRLLSFFNFDLDIAAPECILPGKLLFFLFPLCCVCFGPFFSSHLPFHSICSQNLTMSTNFMVHYFFLSSVVFC